MLAYRNLFQQQLTEAPKKKMDKQFSGYNNELGWVFLSNDCKELKSVRTYHSLFSAVGNYTYYTPNTFYRNDQRNEASLRWLNAMVVDIDVKGQYGNNKGLTLPDVMTLIEDAGLPQASLIVQTPSGGFHVYWYFQQSKRAFPSTISTYETIQKAIASSIRGDEQAIGAERWFRMPTAQNILFQTKDFTNFDSLLDWYEINFGEAKKEINGVLVDPKNLFQHAAIKKLLQGVSEGQRDNTCYTLALAYKAVGYAKEDTEDLLIKWNEKNSPKMTQIDIKRKVKSAFKPGSPNGPSAEYIRLLSGMNFYYITWEPAKPREERKNSHFDEWEKDIIRFLQSNGGSVTNAQRKIASAIKSSVDGELNIPYSSFKIVLERLIQSGRVIKTVIGKGRGAVTTLVLVNKAKVYLFEKKKTTKFNGLNSYTYKDQVVGGFSPRAFSISTTLSVFFRGRALFSPGDPPYS